MHRRALVTGLACTLVLVPVAALAHEGDSGHGRAASTTSSEAAPGAEQGEHAAEGEEKEPDWEAGLDFVGGATSIDVLSEGRPTRVELPPANVPNSTRITSLSFIPGLERHIGPKLTLGARIPIIDGDLRSRDNSADPRSVFMAGNLELEGRYQVLARRTWQLFGTLGIALPTGGGGEPPTDAEVAADPTKRFDYRKIDRWAAARAASFARGGYESALFEPGRFGIIPKVSALVKAGNLSLAPMVKVENLIDVTGDAKDKYVGEIVGGVRAGYLVAAHVEPALNAWVAATFTSTDEKDTTFVVAEPGVRFPFERIAPEAGVILPFVGHLWDDKTWGLRLAVTGEF
jgi:hypothetical protein